MKTRRFASIDIGSNAIRLLICTVYEYENRKPKFHKTSLVRLPIRLGGDVFSEQKISAYNIKRLIEAMKAYRSLMNAFEIEEYKAYATSAMREAKNGEQVVKMIQEQADISIEIISGEKEADIIFLTELDKFRDSGDNYLYVDVGGGSTELTLLSGGKVVKSKSFKVGTVRFLEGKVDDDFFKDQVKGWVKEYVKDKKVSLIGSGGNINYIFKRYGKKTKEPLTFKELNEFYKEIKSLDYEERMEEYGMKPDRADVIEPALKIFTQIMKWANADEIFVPKIGLTDGMIQYMYNKSKDA